MAYRLLKMLIATGKTGIERTIEEYYEKGRITEAERDELLLLAQL